MLDSWLDSLRAFVQTPFGTAVVFVLALAALAACVTSLQQADDSHEDWR